MLCSLDLEYGDSIEEELDYGTTNICVVNQRNQKVHAHNLHYVISCTIFALTHVDASIHLQTQQPIGPIPSPNLHQLNSQPYPPNLSEFIDTDLDNSGGPPRKVSEARIWGFLRRRRRRRQSQRQ